MASFPPPAEPTPPLQYQHKPPLISIPQPKQPATINKAYEVNSRTIILQLLAGGVSGAVTKTATAPLERVKILLQLQGMKCAEGQPPKYKGIIHTLRVTAQEEGIRGWFKGNGANVLRVVPVYALKFMFNDSFKNLVRTPGKPLTNFQLMASGTLAGLFQQVCTYPLETIRTRLTLGASMGVQYRGITHAFTETYKYEGFSGFYKGLGPTIISGSPYVGLQMSAYEILNEKFDTKSMDPFLREMVKMVNGAIAGVVAQTLTYPGDTIRRRMQTNGVGGEPRMYSDSFDCFRKIVRNEGWKLLFAGLWANVVRAIPGAAVQFWCYDAMKVVLGIA
jgi:hypothetical protein